MSRAERQETRRSYGLGSLKEIEHGVWRMRVHIGIDVITGRKIQPSRRFRGSRAAAEKELLRFRAEMEARGPQRRALPTRVTVNELVERHLESSEDLAPGTRRSYQSLLEKHIAPGFGRTPTMNITAHAMRTYYRRLAEESNLSDSSIWSIYSLISGALRRAQREDGLAFDRNQLVTPRKAHRPEKQLLSDAELARVFHVAEDLGDDWPLLIRTLCATGMRRGEAASLRWSALNRDNVLSIRSGAVDTRGGVVEKLPKTGQRRELLIDDATAAQWRQRQATVRDAMRSHELPFAISLHVFSNDPTRTAPLRPDLISKKWVVISRRAEVTPGVELRSLRNWHITVLREAGFPLEFIGRRVGHDGRGASPLAMTASYTVSRMEVEQQMTDVIKNRIESILSPA